MYRETTSFSKKSSMSSSIVYEITQRNREIVTKKNTVRVKCKVQVLNFESDEILDYFQSNRLIVALP